MTSKLESNGSINIQNVAIVSPQLKIDNLPQELLEKVFSNLSQYDLQSVASVNSYMSKSVQEAANFNEPLSIKKFTNSVIENLNIELFSGQIESLHAIKENINTQNGLKLLELKGYILDLKQELINVIKTLNEESLNILINHVKPPHFLEDIFESAKFERMIDRSLERATLIEDEIDRGNAFADICAHFILRGNFDRAMVVVESIPNGIRRGYTLRDISEAILVATGDIERATLVAKMIPDEMFRNNALSELAILMPFQA